jgi:glycerol uptake facilitator-like aquaporin
VTAINPTRVFGPALAVGFWDAHYVYSLGPMVGGALAGLVYKGFLWPKELGRGHSLVAFEHRFW